MPRWLAVSLVTATAAALGFAGGYWRANRALTHPPRPASHAEVAEELTRVHELRAQLQERVERLGKELERLAQENDRLRQQRAAEHATTAHGAPLPERPPK